MQVWAWVWQQVVCLEIWFEPMHRQSQQMNNAVNQPSMRNSRFSPKNSDLNADMDQVQNSDEDPVAILTKLKKMLDAGLIEPSEYDAKKTEILKRM